MRRLRVGWLAPEDSTLPPDVEVGSVTNTIHQLVSRLEPTCEFVLGTREHPLLGSLDLELDRVRYRRARADGDVARVRAVTLLNQVQRRLHVRDLPPAGRASYFRGYARAHARRFAAEGVDLVHLYNTSQWVPHLRAALPRTPIVLQMHCEWLAEIPRREGLARLGLLDRVLAVSEQVADQIRERYPEHAAIVEVHRNGVDLDEFRPAREVRAERAAELAALRRRLGLDGGPVVLFVGRLSAEKGLHTLLEAFPAVLARFPDAQLVLAGGSAGLRSPLPTRERRELLGHPEWRARYGEHLRRLAEPFGDRVRFPGSLAAAEVPLAFALADVYVQPSVLEAFGLPVVEAMAAALPVVASDGGALPELVVDGRTGFVVPAGAGEALGEAIVRVLDDPALAAGLGDAGRARAEREFGWDAAASRLLEIYAGLARPAERAGRRPAFRPDADLGPARS